MRMSRVLSSTAGHSVDGGTGVKEAWGRWLPVIDSALVGSGRGHAIEARRDGVRGRMYHRSTIQPFSSRKKKQRHRISKTSGRRVPPRTTTKRGGAEEHDDQGQRSESRPLLACSLVGLALRRGPKNPQPWWMWGARWGHSASLQSTRLPPPSISSRHVHSTKKSQPRRSGAQRLDGSTLASPA